MKWTDLRVFNADEPDEYFEYYEEYVDEFYGFQENVDVSAYFAYLILKQKFGLPEEDDEKDIAFWVSSKQVVFKITLSNEGSIFDFQSGNDSKENSTFLSGIAVFAMPRISTTMYKFSEERQMEITKKECQEFITLLIRDIQKDSKSKDTEVKSLIEKAPRTVIQNPYSLYINSAEKLLDQAKDLNKYAQIIYELPYLQAIFFLFMTAFEGFINLIYELYLDENLAKEQTIVERINRFNIDLRILLAPHFCICFEKGKIGMDEIFKKYKDIIQLRNDYVHANVVVPMRYGVYELDDMNFLVNRETQLKSKHGLPKNSSKLSLQDIELVQKTVSEMTEKIIEAMKPLYKIDFTSLMRDSYIVKRSADEPE